MYYLVRHKNIYCRHSFELPHRDASNKDQQHALIFKMKTENLCLSHTH